PVSNSTAYIMDKHHKLLPVGVPGELCVGGDGVARGYLNRPELTEEKFIVNPYVPQERIYKTGDLARWLPDGNLEFLGRIDQQVKIRGYRIELGEIEKQLTKHPLVNEAVVIDRKDESGASYLCGYLVGDGELSVAEVKEHLHRELPDYTVPAYLVTLEKLPLTPNGKIDKKALPEPDVSQSEREIVAPR
ncbi:AMP-binding enzyme, partial [Brevibacillus sp. SYSU BS000544]|uniref:AMP-binding enzyme n=1 Tax=Brevibacillus sp. SYSU BS000544 TaxID=3416443 RepID=UPI003CE5335E